MALETDRCCFAARPRLWVAQAVDDHQLDMFFEVERLTAMFGQGLKNIVEFQALPDFLDREDVAEVESVLQGGFLGRGPADGFADTVDDVVHIPLGQLLDLAKVSNDLGNGMFAPGRVAIGVDDLHGSIRFMLLFAGDDSDVHSTTDFRKNKTVCQTINVTKHPYLRTTKILNFAEFS